MSPVNSRANCLPDRVKLILAAIDRGETDVLVRMIDESSACISSGDGCGMREACLRLHAAFLPLIPKH